MPKTYAIVWLLAACTSSGSPEEGPDVVITAQGAVRGVRNGDARSWLGIPYAAPPVGELRWQPPMPAVAWNGVRDARGWAASCVEISTSGALLGGSEDCLYLNVWAPATAAGPLPVMFFIHGGFYLRGSSSQVLAGERVFDGAYLAAHGPAVIVTINYRLGALGFFTSDALAAESGNRTSGNYALRDQLAALQWVHDNIAAFGGDPTHVMVFGESAGGSATCSLYSSPRAHGLMSGALVESGGCVTRTPEMAAASSQALVDRSGCGSAPNVIECLRALPADRIATAVPVDLEQSFDRWGPIVDGDVLPVAPLQAIASGGQNHVPVIFGTTSNEYSTLIQNFQAAPIRTDDEYRAAVARFFPQHTDIVLARYPSSAYASPQQALITLLSDAYMTCPTRKALRAAAASQAEPVRRYVFAHTYESGTFAALGAGHGLDLPFEFHNLNLQGFTATSSELALANAIGAYWTQFAASGDPNLPTLPSWPRYDASTDPAIILDDAIASVSGVRTAQCDFWNP